MCRPYEGTFCIRHGRPRGSPLRFYEGRFEPLAGGSWPAPTANTEAVLSFRRGRTLAGPQIYAARPGGRALRLSTSHHLLGKARRRCGIAPASIFGKPGPSGPDWNVRKPLRFCAPEILQNLASTRPPVMGVLGDGRHGGRGGAAASADCARPLAVFWCLSGRGERHSPPERRNRVSERNRRTAKRTSAAEGDPPPYRVLLTMLVPRTPPHPPQCAHWGTFSLSPSVATRHLGPLTRGVGPQGGRLLRIIISE